MKLVIHVISDRDAGLTYQFAPWLHEELAILATMSSTDER
jgi:hypothetical protein